MNTTSMSRRLFARTLGALSASAMLGLRMKRAVLAQTPATLPVQDAYTFLGLGIDTRTVTEPENADVIMIARVDTLAPSIRVVSIPRDLLVEIPGYGVDKINRAYDYGTKAANVNWDAGVALTSQTITHNFAVTIDAVATTNLWGMPPAIDALGGIDVTNPYDVSDDQYPTMDYGTRQIYFPAGPLHLNGEDALAFARTRHQDGDDGRVMRQHILLTEVLRTCQSPAILTTLPDIIKAQSTNVFTNLPLEVQAQLLGVLPRIDPDADLIWHTITDQLGTGYTDTGMWVYQADWTTLPGIVQSMLFGDI